MQDRPTQIVSNHALELRQESIFLLLDIVSLDRFSSVSNISAIDRDRVSYAHDMVSAVSLINSGVGIASRAAVLISSFMEYCGYISMSGGWSGRSETPSRIFSTFLAFPGRDAILYF